MEANRQSLVSRAACVAVALSCLVPMVEYLNAMEPTRRSPVQLFIKDVSSANPHYLMALWFVPPLLAVVRLSAFAWKAHVYLAATAVAISISEFFLAAVGPGNPTFAHLQVYFGIEGVVPAVHWGLHAGLVGGFSAVWMFDELRATHVFKSFDAK